MWRTFFYMEKRQLTVDHITAYGQYLRTEERSSGTIEKYLREIRAFNRWLGDRPITKECLHEWKEYLQENHYAPATINSMLAPLNSLFRFLGWDYRIKFLKIQRKIFREENRELSRTEYNQLLETAKAHGKEWLALLMETICATGIRVSEVRYITVEAAQCGRASIFLKGKNRVILIPAKLCRKLLKYARKQKTVTGEIFLTNDGKSLHRCRIWAEMKRISKYAGVAQSKVFPHNLRHLFATVFYRAYKDIVKLADLLGHSSIETTRIYLMTSGLEHQQQLDRLCLVS